MPTGIMKPVTFAGTSGTLTFNSDSLYTLTFAIDSAEPMLRLTTLGDGTVHDANFGTQAPLRYPISRRLSCRISNATATAVAIKFESLGDYIGDYGTFTAEDSNSTQWTANCYMGRLTSEADQPIATQKHIEFDWEVIQIDEWVEVP